MSGLFIVLCVIAGLYALRGLYRAAVRWAWKYGGGGYDN